MEDGEEPIAGLKSISIGYIEWEKILGRIEPW